ncbi:hypothetical protein N0V83_010830 [Neocucurbitaria cava]|uniref:Uncharacterized protein n=1 Tax=Neocucurbitaria cava TaxID=798079 RepID=A0A9W9CH23_9PLEO|nr:hypothetical protein N0V83_010830 [Neocucurbitaria cava]
MSKYAKRNELIVNYRNGETGTERATHCHEVGLVHRLERKTQDALEFHNERETHLEVVKELGSKFHTGISGQGLLTERTSQLHEAQSNLTAAEADKSMFEAQARDQRAAVERLTTTHEVAKQENLKLDTKLQQAVASLELATSRIAKMEAKAHRKDAELQQADDTTKRLSDIRRDFEATRVQLNQQKEATKLRADLLNITHKQLSLALDKIEEQRAELSAIQDEMDRAQGQTRDAQFAAAFHRHMVWLSHDRAEQLEAESSVLRDRVGTASRVNTEQSSKIRELHDRVDVSESTANDLRAQFSTATDTIRELRDGVDVSASTANNLRVKKINDARVSELQVELGCVKEVKSALEAEVEHLKERVACLGCYRGAVIKAAYQGIHRSSAQPDVSWISDNFVGGPDWNLNAPLSVIRKAQKADTKAIYKSIQAIVSRKEMTEQHLAQFMDTVKTQQPKYSAALRQMRQANEDLRSTLRRLSLDMAALEADKDHDIEELRSSLEEYKGFVKDLRAIIEYREGTGV